jgi:purine nucleosidase
MNNRNISRKYFGIITGLILVMSCAGPASQEKWPESVKAKTRIIIDADTANELDDLFAITRALIAPEFIIEGLTSTHWRGQNSVEKSQHLNEKILEKMELSEIIPHPQGAAHAMPDNQTPVDSPAARHIIARAHAGGMDNKLLVVALGTATNLASALLLDPTIKDKVVYAFIDGDYKGGQWGQASITGLLIFMLSR